VVDRLDRWYHPPVTPEPTISRQDAIDICAHPWPDELSAREQAVILDAAGWRVEHRRPAVAFGQTGRLIVASVYHPETFSSPGDVTYTEQ
jgi:hypothetical protein